MLVTNTVHIADAWRVYLCLYVGHNLLKRIKEPCNLRYAVIFAEFQSVVEHRKYLAYG